MSIKRVLFPGYLKKLQAMKSCFRFATFHHANLKGTHRGLKVGVGMGVWVWCGVGWGGCGVGWGGVGWGGVGWGGVGWGGVGVVESSLKILKSFCKKSLSFKF